jgi:hypothetical protein
MILALRGLQREVLPVLYVGKQDRSNQASNCDGFSLDVIEGDKNVPAANLDPASLRTHSIVLHYNHAKTET